MAQNWPLLHKKSETQDPSNILNDKGNGIYILPAAPMPTEKLITYLPTCDNTILYVMITLVSINLMILLYKFLTRKLQHSTRSLSNYQLDTMYHTSFD